ncbi:MAG: phosphatidylserine decarboxylase [Woeseiaceae bacterium]
MEAGRRNPFVAREGLPFLLLAAIALAYAIRYLDVFFGLAAAFMFLVLYLLFRDPRRDVPPAPLGVVSPVDGRVLSVDRVEQGVLQGEAHRIRIEIDSFGTYTARAPVEGKILDLRSVAADSKTDYETNALWVQTDEGDDVVLQFTGYRFGLAPRSFVQFGGRVGQGQRCAYLRLTRCAEVHLPVTSKVLVDPGQIVIAGTDLIGKVPHP